MVEFDEGDGGASVNQHVGAAAADVKIRYGQPATRDEEIEALQARLARLEALVARDEDVLRKVLGLLVEKGITTREEILERIK